MTRTLEHRPIQVMQFINSHGKQVTVHVCDDCLTFRQQTEDEITYRDQDLEGVHKGDVRCPGLRCRSCEYGEKHDCFWQIPAEWKPRYGPAAPTLCEGCERQSADCPYNGEICSIHGDCGCIECRHSPAEHLV